MPTLEEIRKQFEAAKKAPVPEAKKAPATEPAPAAPPPPAPKAATTPTPPPPAAKAPVKKAAPPKPPAPVVVPVSSTPTVRTPERAKPAATTPAPAATTPQPGTPEYAAAEAAYIASLPPEKQAAVRELDRLAAEATSSTEETPLEDLARRASAATAASGARRTPTSPVREAVKGLGRTLLPVAAEAVRAAGEVPGAPKDTQVADPVVKTAEKGAQAVEQKFTEASEEAAAEQARRQEQANARFEQLYGQDEEMQAARAVADRVRMDERTTRKNANTKFLSEYRQELVNKEVQKRGGPDAITSGPEYAAIEQEAHDKAVAKLAALRTTGQWFIPLSAEEAALEGPGPAGWRAFLPKQEVRQDGKTVRTEGLGEWFVTVPISVLDTALLTWMQGYDGDIEGRDFSTRFFENVAGRQDVLTYRIEQDPELQADLSSGDPARVRKALKTLGPFVGLTLMNPDPVSATVAGAKVARKSAQLARYGGDLTAAFRAAKTVPEKVRVLREASATFDAADEAAKVALREDKAARRAHAAVTQYREGATFDDVARSMEKADPAIARRLRDDLAGTLRTDPDVAAYLDDIESRGVDFSPENPPDVAYGPTEIARREAIQQQIDDANAVIRETRKQYGNDLEDVDEGALPAELLRMLDPVIRRKAILRAEEKALAAKEQAAFGRTKFGDHYDTVSRSIIDDLEAQASGVVVPLRARQDYVGAPERPQAPVVDVDALDDIFGPDVTPAVAERLAEVQTPEELVRVLSRVPPGVRDAVVAKLGFADYDALKDAAKATDQAVMDKRAVLEAELLTARTKLYEALDQAAALRAAPGQAAEYAKARKALKAAEQEVTAAEKELAAAGAVDIRDRQKLVAAEAKLQEVDAKGRENLAKLEEAAEAAAAGKESEEAAEIAKIESQLRKHKEDMTPGRTKNGGIPTTGESEKVARENLEAAKKALDDFDKSGPHQQRLDAVDAEMQSVAASKLSKVKKAARQAELDAQAAAIKAEAGPARKALEERVAEADREYNGWGARNNKLNKGWRKKLEDVTAYYEKIRPAKEAEIALLQARIKAKGPTIDPAATARQQKALDALNAAKTKHDAKMQEAEAGLARLRASVAESERKANEAFEAAQARATNARKLFDEASEAYGGVPALEGVRVSEGPEWEARLLKADQRTIAARTRYQERLALLDALGESPAQRASLERALADVRPEMQRVSGQLRARDEFVREQVRIASRGEEPNPVVFLSRDRAQLADELDFLDREARREWARRVGLSVVYTIGKNLRDFWRPYSQIQEASLVEPLRDLTKRLDGEILDIGTRLARAAAAAEPGDGINVAALAAVGDEVHHFKASIAERQIPAEYAAEVISAYLQPGVRLDPETARRFDTVLVDWAEDAESTLEQLRKQLLDLTIEVMGPRAGVTELRMPQMGDVLLAQGVGQAGAVRRLMREIGFGAVTPKGAEQINNVLTDFHKVGGNPRASIGRQRLLRMVLDADDYRPTLTSALDTSRRQDVTEPVVPAYRRAQLPGKSPEQRAEEAVRTLDALGEDLAHMFETEMHVPRAVRDAINKHIEAAVATGRLSATYGMESALDYWRQAIIVGVGLSRPGQGYMDHMGDLMQVATRYPLLAAKTAARSTLSQPLNFHGAAQIAQVVDKFRGAMRGQSVAPGTSARDFDRLISKMTLSPDVQRVLDMTDEMVGSSGLRGRDLGRIAVEEGLYETLLTGQLTRTMALQGTREVPKGLAVAAGVVQGAGAGVVLGGPVGMAVGALAGAIFGSSAAGRKLAASNHAALVDLANIASNRRRVAVYVGLVERGMPPRQAAQEAVRMVGAFSREISPTERKLISSWYPFYAYRKFNTRRAVQVLANPYFLKMLNEAGNQGALVLNALFDDTDEYGLHTGPMSLEPDPGDYEALLEQTRAEHPDWPQEKLYQEVDKLAENLPRAIERYERLLAKLREMPLADARKYLLTSDDPDAALLWGPYFAPDPIKSSLPDWMQGRYVLMLNKARSQELQTYFRSGQARSERGSDEIRYFASPPDPNLEGIQTAMLVLATLSTMGAPEGSAGEDLIGIALRDPRAQAVVDIAGLIDPETTQDTPIPRAVGENLLAAGLGKYIDPKTPLGDAYDPADPNAPEVRDVRYYIPARYAATMYLANMAFKGALAGIQVQQAAEVFRNEKVVGEPDVVDDLGAYSFFFAGQPVRTTSPSMEAFFADKAAEARIEAATPTGQTKPQASMATQRIRFWTSLEARPDFEARLARIVDGMAADPTARPGADEVPYLRALLARSLPPEQVANMTTEQVVQAVRAQK